MKRLLQIVLILVFVFTLSGCQDKEVSQPDSQGNNEINEGESKQEQPDEVEVEPAYIAPLTGLPTDHEVKDRIIGVMINNHSQARPQSGLIQADMVYEVLAEGMITRFVAFFHSQLPDIIGPVRSIRPYYINIINGFDALIVHAGSSTDALAVLQHSSLPDLDEIENAGDAFWRESFRKAPHNVYTSIEKIRAAAERRGYKSEGYIPTFPFLNNQEEAEGYSAKKIEVTYSSDYKVEYQYDEGSKKYLRFINGKPHTDLETKMQLTATNLLVIRAEHKIVDQQGRRVIDIDGPGQGYLFQKGVEKEIIWERRDGVIRPYFNDTEQGLFPGQTWVIVVQPQTNVSWE